MSVGTQEDHPNVAVADSSSRKAVSFSSAHDETLPVVAVRVCNPSSFAYWSDVLSVELKRFIASVLTMTT
jgi:hypothetical protein